MSLILIKWVCRDCSLGNIMMDAPSVFPNGFHPCSITRDRGGVHGIKTIPRYKASGPIRYYFVDFGISRLYEEGEEHSVIGGDGADQDIPEMADQDSYDPFPADVFIVGNVFKKHFIPVSSTSGLFFPSQSTDREYHLFRNIRILTSCHHSSTR